MTANVAPKEEQNLESYIILERKDSNDILVSQQITDQDLDWYKTHRVLHQKGFFMPNPRQFFDFLNLLQSPRRLYNGTGKKLSTVESDQRKIRILNDILEQRGQYRAEHLDARFFVYNGIIFIAYDHRTINGELQATRVEPLEKCAMKNYYVDLKSMNRQGLPTRKSGTQTYSRGENIYFWPPTGNSTTRFWAGSVGVGLGCDGGPRGSSPGLGVRRQKFLEK